jgi:hypothetical protein
LPRYSPPAGTGDATEKGMLIVMNGTTTAAAQHFIPWSAVAEL